MNDNNEENQSGALEKQELKEMENAKKTVKKTQGQLIQEALGLGPEETQKIEQKLFVARFFDYFSEETLDFIYKDSAIENYNKQITAHLDSLSASSEEDKLLKQSFEGKQIMDVVKQLKTNAEKQAAKSGMTKSIESKLKKINLILIVVMLGITTMLFIFQALLADLFMLILPVFCVFCMLPQILRGVILKKWFEFKRQNKTEYYKDNRAEILILKGFVAEVLENIRAKLLEMKVPLQLIKFTLHSRDYDNLNLINQRTVRNINQYYFSFEYPPGVEPFPIPDVLKNIGPAPLKDKPMDEIPEKNFIVLTEITGKKGIIESFIPRLRDNLADQINDLLNNCEFYISPNDFSKIIPNYSAQLGIYCPCGDLVKITYVQICNWKKSTFKFYLMEGETCKCGEKVFAISLMDETSEIPIELKDIFA